MKKIILLILLVAGTAFSQFQTVGSWRSVFVSTNYRNVYPRYSTLQSAYNSCKDSADAGKYFLVWLVTSYQNITDWSTGWKDSILNKSPYLTLIELNRSAGDSIIGVNTSQFNLIAGILELNSLTAGNGLTFSGDKYSIVTQNYLGNALYLDTDSLKLRVQAPLYFTPNLLGIKVSTNSGIRFSDSVYIVPYKEVYTDNDTLLIRKSFYFLPYDSLTLDWNTQHFNLIYGVSPAINVKLDSGLTAGTDGIRAWLDNVRVGYTATKRITITDATGGDALAWQNDSLNLIVGSPFETSGDSLWLNFNTDQFSISYSASPKFSINLDSGMTYDIGGIKPDLDYVTLIFNSLMQLAINPTFAGGGLLVTTGVMSIVPNEFAKIENDTLKIKSSYTYQFYGDSLTSLVTSAGVGILPYDTTGICVLYKGKIKRVTYTYQLSGGNDTVITTANNVDVNNNTDKIRCVWENGSSEMKIQIWTLASRTWSNAITLSFPNFADSYWRVVAELYAEAQ